MLDATAIVKTPKRHFIALHASTYAVMCAVGTALFLVNAIPRAERFDIPRLGSAEFIRQGFPLTARHSLKLSRPTAPVSTNRSQPSSMRSVLNSGGSFDISVEGGRPFFEDGSGHRILLMALTVDLVIAMTVVGTLAFFIENMSRRKRLPTNANQLSDESAV